ncbi:conserved hypothetical protein [Gammaproteobacteria bacterium]
MTMDKSLRDELRKATQSIRRLLETEFTEQLAGTFDILVDGTVLPAPGSHLSAAQCLVREKLVAAVTHKQSVGHSPRAAVEAYLREAAFTALNRFVALKMLEARGLVQECISRGEESSGFKEFTALAPGLVQLPDKGYRLYIESLFDEIGQEVRVLFNRRDVASLLWPRRAALVGLLELLNGAELKTAWAEDETIGWLYQYFNSSEERKAMRDASQAPRDSRELAVRNQFFTPRYVVEFLTDNTLGRLWVEMTQGQTRLKEHCRHLICRPDEVLPHRPLKDPRDIRLLDPACGSMHFGLYAFDLFEVIYAEAWDFNRPAPGGEGLVPLRERYASREAYWRDVPRLIIEYNLHGIDIDPRAAQIAGLSLWLRAQRAWQQQTLPAQDRPPIRRSNVVCAEPMPGEQAFLDEFIAGHLSATPEDRLLGQLIRRVFEAMKLAGEAGSLLGIEAEIAGAVAEAKLKWLPQKVHQLGLFDDEMPLIQEQKGELNVTGITDKRFWEQVEGRIYAALQAYAEQAEQSGGYQQRLFADDAARGFAFIDLCRQRYDIVLMNPPFGALGSKAKDPLAKAYPRSKNDLLAVFVERGLALLHPGGRIGAITSRTGFFLSSFQKWREEVVLGMATPEVMADLGHGVMDDAMVEAAAYCLIKR